MVGPLPENVRVLSELATHHDGYSIEDERVMEALSRAEDRHFWHVSRNEFISNRLRRLGLRPPARILELGCGGGCVAAHLAGLGYDVTGVDGHLRRVLQASGRAPQATFIVHDLTRGIDALEPLEFDAVALFDVIEHLDDPATALAQALSRAAAGRLLVGTVPAMKSLWSSVDVRSGHRLRYGLSELVDLLRKVPGAEIVEVAAFNRSLVPMLWLQRTILPGADALERGLKVPWAPINALLQGVLRLEHRVAATLDRLAIPGASLWFAARRRVTRFPLRNPAPGNER